MDMGGMDHGSGGSTDAALPSCKSEYHVATGLYHP